MRISSPYVNMISVEIVALKEAFSQPSLSPIKPPTCFTRSIFSTLLPSFVVIYDGGEEVDIQ
jgi:hypothetical protein